MGVASALEGLVAVERDGERLASVERYGSRFVSPDVGGERWVKGVSGIETVALTPGEDPTELEALSLDDPEYD
ncbi:sulfite oxidase-like oxidoreductase [Candidatus Halobonum tyrrellensis G22]|uniref:Sulfite oxidase-like oxidoreductase n=1 Tax=Candidatus Halobonum tyrrellensis G22 TaxID=1324957 RepID=V4GWZ3_9EURY|nr:sulfite oxidase-like oxidoreductase [Candidatus Halobonum tyrrellensis G22]